jgi:hypothetical protein
MASGSAHMFQNNPTTAPQSSAENRQMNPLQDPPGGDGVGVPERGIQEEREVVPPFSDTSSWEELKSFLTKCHVMPNVISAIPQGFGVGMFICLDRGDLDSLSDDGGIRMMVRTAQTLVRREVEKPSIITEAPVVSAAAAAAEVVAAAAAANALERANRIQEPAAVVRDNVDPYLLSESLTPAGIIDICNLYGVQEGGVPTIEVRLPSTKKGSHAPKGLHAITIPDLGVNLITNDGDNKTLKVKLWHTQLMIGNADYWTHLGEGP